MIRTTHSKNRLGLGRLVTKRETTLLVFIIMTVMGVTLYSPRFFL